MYNNFKGSEKEECLGLCSNIKANNLINLNKYK